MCVCVCVCVYLFSAEDAEDAEEFDATLLVYWLLKALSYQYMRPLYLFSAEDPEDGQELASAHLLLALYHAVVAALVVQLGVLVQRVHVRVLDAVLLHQLQRRQALVPEQSLERAL